EAEGKAGRLDLRMTAVIEATADDSRAYRAATESEESFALAVSHPEDPPSIPMPSNPRWFSPPLFGFTTQADLYTARQLRVMMAFADAVAEVGADVERDGGTEAQLRVIVALLGL